MEKRYEERRQRGRYDGPACYADVCTWHSLSREYTGTVKQVNLVPRSFPPPVFDRLQYARRGGQGLGYSPSDQKLKIGRGLGIKLTLGSISSLCWHTVTLSMKNLEWQCIMYRVCLFQLMCGDWEWVCATIATVYWIYIQGFVSSPSPWILFASCLYLIAILPHLFTGAPWRPHLSKPSTRVSEPTVKLPECR